MMARCTVIVQQRTVQMATTIEDQLSWALARIIELEESLEDAQDTIRRLVEGNACRWDA